MIAFGLTELHEFHSGAKERDIPRLVQQPTADDDIQHGPCLDELVVVSTGVMTSTTNVPSFEMDEILC